MTLRQAAPLHVSLFGMQLLPPNHARLRLELAQLMPTGPPSASLSTLVTHGNFARPCPKGASSSKPMKFDQGALSTVVQKYWSTGEYSFGIGLACMNCVASAGATRGQSTFWARPFGFNQGKRNRFPAL